MTPSEFWATKSSLPEYLTVTFDHPDMGTIRLVADQYAPVTIAGHEYTPAPMSITPPEQASDPIAKLRVSFPRAVVGREFKRRLKQISAAGRLSPIVVTYSHWIGSDLSAPVSSWPLYVDRDSGIVFSSETVQVTATDDNPLRLNCSEIYDPTVWTGLLQV